MEETETNKPTSCFVVMPITDPDGYIDGHFARVYTHLIKPACDKAGIDCVRADEIKCTNYIVINILHKILDSDLVICDLSSRNPNVLYELGIRQAFNLPVVLIKDKQTDRIFDIQGLRTLDYDETLRIDTVQHDVAALSTSIGKTLAMKPEDVNSLVQLLGVRKAELSAGTEMSAETTLVLTAIRDLSHRITGLEEQRPHHPSSRSRATRLTLPDGSSVHYGETVTDGPGGKELGTFEELDTDGILIRYPEGKRDGVVGFIVPPDSDQYARVTTSPF